MDSLLLFLETFTGDEPVMKKMCQTRCKKKTFLEANVNYCYKYEIPAVSTSVILNHFDETSISALSETLAMEGDEKHPSHK